MDDVTKLIAELRSQQEQIKETILWLERESAARCLPKSISIVKYNHLDALVRLAGNREAAPNEQWP